MSTFNGFVSEFPQIRIDYFRRLPGHPPPLATFLSHIHSDHLVGLESFRSTFIYCSAATRPLLLRLEKYPHRINYAKGILEARVQTYKHLSSLLKPLPIETPTRIELCPGQEIQVTLFEANHCIGAVGFLIQGDGKAVFYSGDVRAEKWWVDALARSPMMLPFVHGLSRLDRLYMDTTFAVNEAPYKEFPSKAIGIAELLRKLQGLPRDAIVYFHAWTFGYEDVFLALSQALESPIHLDRYRYSLYTSVGQNSKTTLGHQHCKESPIFSGFTFGNTQHPGIFTRDPSKARIHSCEKGTDCPVFNTNAKVVDITPIISRHNCEEMRELGAGGGKGDLDQVHELELANVQEVLQLIELVQAKGTDATLLASLDDALSAVSIGERRCIDLDLPEDIATQIDTSNITISQLVNILSGTTAAHTAPLIMREQPNTITFPYSRHSSQSELSYLVGTLRPRDVYPCVAPKASLFTEEMSMEGLFGDVCSDGVFAWDQEIRVAKAAIDDAKAQQEVEEAEKQQQSKISQDADNARLNKRWQRQTDARNMSRYSHDCKSVDGEHRIDRPGAVVMDKRLVNADIVKNVHVTEVPDHRESRCATVITIDSQSSCDADVQAAHPLTLGAQDKASKSITPPRCSNPAKRKDREASLSGRSKERLRAREEAFEAAREGRWGTVRLASTRRVIEIEEEL